MDEKTRLDLACDLVRAVDQLRVLQLAGRDTEPDRLAVMEAATRYDLNDPSYRRAFGMTIAKQRQAWPPRSRS